MTYTKSMRNQMKREESVTLKGKFHFKEIMNESFGNASSGWYGKFAVPLFCERTNIF